MTKREQITSDSRVIKSDFRYPTMYSKKKKWYVTFNCDKCNKEIEKIVSVSSHIWMCNECGKGRRTTPEFIKRAIETHGEKYTYDKVDYVNNDTKVTITCPEHGDWNVRPTDFLSGGNCPVCSRIVGSKSKEHTIDQWQGKLSNPLVVITDKLNKNFGKFKCKLHGEFKARFANAASSKVSGCTVCDRLRHHKQSINSKLIGTKVNIYWIYLPRIDMYKLGCTTQPIKERFSGEEVTTIWTTKMDYIDGLEFEHKVHKAFTNLRYKGSLKLLKEGTNECFHNNEFPTYKDLKDKLNERI